MGKLCISNSEVILSFTILFVLLCVMFNICSYVIVAIIVLYIIGIYSHSKINKLPAGCVINLCGLIELHIDNKNDGSTIKFFELCSKSILKCIELKKTVLIDSWIIQDDKMKKIFSDSVTIYKPSLIQCLANFINKIIYDRKSLFKNNSYRYLIDTNKLSQKQIEKLKKLNSRMNRNKKVIL